MFGIIEVIAQFMRDKLLEKKTRTPSDIKSENDRKLTARENDIERMRTKVVKLSKKRQELIKKLEDCKKKFLH